VSFRFQFRRGTTAERNASNPILAAGEPAVVLDSGQPAELVLGDGVTAMADLRAAVWDDDTRLALADTATQPGDLATVATTGAYANLSGKPALGTAAATASTDYATAAQGAKADTAVQPVNYPARFLSKVKAGTAVKVTILGDSIYQGSTATTPGTDDAISLLCTGIAARFGVTVTKSNRSSGGRTAFWERLEQWAAALADNADLYLIGMTGKNDNTWEANGANNARLTGYKTADSLAAIEAMVRELRAVKPKADILIASGNPYGTVYASSNVYQLTYSNGLAQLAAAYGCAYADGYTPFPRDPAAPLNAAATHLSDGTHPNSAGHAVLAAALLALFPATFDPARSPASSLVDATPAGAAVWPVRTARTGLLSLTTQGLTANTDRIPNPSFFGTWTGTGPWTSSTVNAYAVGMAKASEFFFKFKMGAGQGVVDLYVNARPVATNVDLSTLQDGKYLAAKTVAPGVNYATVVVKSGTVEFQGFSYTASVGEHIDIDATRVAVANPGSVGAGTVFFGGRQHITLANTVFTFEFVGTGLAVIVSRIGTGGGAYWASVVVDGVTTTRPDLPADWNGQGAHVLTSGLTYGRHTVVLTSLAIVTVGGFSAFDERPEIHPGTCEGMAKVGETVRFPYPWTDTPTVQVTSTTANVAGASTVTASSFLVTGTAGDLVKWRATSEQRGIY